MKPYIIHGTTYHDDRGYMQFFNDMDWTKIKRSYMILTPNRKFVRAWHGHKHEAKYVQAINGSLLVGMVHIDEWDYEEAEVGKVVLSSCEPAILCIPAGYAHGFKTLEDDTQVIFYSTNTVEESKLDDIRFPWDHWDIWEDDYR